MAYLSCFFHGLNLINENIHCFFFVQYISTSADSVFLVGWVGGGDKKFKRLAGKEKQLFFSKRQFQTRTTKICSLFILKKKIRKMEKFIHDMITISIRE